jgi:4'-phosphopantetheinyl transferase
MFFCGWTRKEAYLKAIGDGLSAPLDSVRVTLQPDVPLRFIHIGHDMAVAEHWTLSSFPIAAGYESAVAYADRERHVSVFPIADVGEFSRI